MSVLLEYMITFALCLIFVLMAFGGALLAYSIQDARRSKEAKRMVKEMDKLMERMENYEPPALDIKEVKQKVEQ